MGNFINRRKNVTKNPRPSTDSSIDSSMYHKLKICSFNTRFDQTANSKDKIDQLCKFILSSDFDILCLQNINDSKVIKHIAKKIHDYNLSTHAKRVLQTYPIVESCRSAEISTNDTLKITWSRSNSNDVISEINSLVITKHEIISGSRADINTYICNIDFNGIIVSIYNVNDALKNMRLQIKKPHVETLKNIISSNHISVLSDEIYGPYKKRNIHLVCCQTHINEINDNAASEEYLLFTRTLVALDVYRYIQTIKKQTAGVHDATNSGGTRNNYILLANLDPRESLGFDNINNISKSLQYNQKILVKKTNTNKTMSLFDDYPIEITFGLLF